MSRSIFFFKDLAILFSENITSSNFYLFWFSSLPLWTGLLLSLTTFYFPTSQLFHFLLLPSHLHQHHHSNFFTLWIYYNTCLLVIEFSELSPPLTLSLTSLQTWTSLAYPSFLNCFEISHATYQVLSVPLVCLFFKFYFIAFIHFYLHQFLLHMH